MKNDSYTRKRPEENVNKRTSAKAKDIYFLRLLNLANSFPIDHADLKMKGDH